MKEINVENFSYSSVKTWIMDYSHKEKVELAIYCAELVIDLYKGGSDAPRLAIEAAKVWVKSPTKDNQEKCKKAANAAAYAAAYAAYAADAAADAADAAANAAYAAYAAYAAADAADAAESIKEKIINYINGKLTQQAKDVEWDGVTMVGGDDTMWRKFGSTVEFFANPDFEFDDARSGWIDGDELFVVGYRQVWGIAMAVVQNMRTQNCSAIAIACIRKPETEAEKVERERLESAYDLYESAQHEIGCIGYDSFELFKKSKVQVKFWLAIVDKTKYRKGE